MATTHPHSALRSGFPRCFASTSWDPTESPLETRKGLKALLCRERAWLISSLSIWLIILFSFTPDVLAQYQFDTWTTENGLPQNSINDILQTRDGYLWLATNGGLVRFDGARFMVFDRSIEGIRSQRLLALLEDSKGTLWVGAENGMLIRYRDAKFTTFTVESGLPNTYASRIEEGNEGNLWITWHGAANAVTKFDGERFINYGPADFPHAVSGHTDKRRYPWWSQDSTGLHCLIKGRVQTYSFQSGLPRAQINFINADQYGNLWIQTRGAGVVKATNGQLKLYTTREGLPSNDVEGVFFEDRKGNLWFTDYGGNLYRITDGKHELMSTISGSKFYEDREGSIWIGTLVGLHRVRELAITVLAEREGLSHNWVYPILQDRKGAIWIGSRGVNKYENGRFTHYRISEGLPSEHIQCIYEDNSGRLWVGTWGPNAIGAVSYFKNGRFKAYVDEYGFLKRSAWVIRQDHDGNLWFGTDQGLVKLKDGQFTKYTSKDGLSYDWITALFEDRAGSLWIGTHQGLTRLKDGVFTSFTKREGFIGNQVRAIYEDADGVLWVGTYDGGLYRLKDEQLTRYTTKEGLHDNGVFQILEDDAGNLWMGCNRGIYRVSRQELNDFAEGRVRSITSVVYGTRDGLSSLECNGGRQPSGLKTEDGRLWFPTMGGVAIVDPKATRSNTVPPPPAIIEEVRLDNETVDFSSSVEIPRDKNSFEIRYTAPSFIKPEQLRFRYMLEGLDKDWVEAGNRRTASYYRIPPGRYRFRVIAANHDGVWNETGAALEFYLRPYFYETWWFYPLCLALGVVAVILAGIGMHRRHVKQLKEKAEAERIEAYGIIAAGVVHDVNGPLGTLQIRVHNIRKGINRPDEVKSQLDAIEKTTDRLKHLTNALRDFAEPQPLQFAPTDVGKLLKDVVTIYRREHDVNFPQIKIMPDGQSKDGVQSALRRIAMDKHQMERVLLNLIGNAVKHAKGLSTVRLSAEVKQKRLRIQVANDGTGIEADHLPRIFAPFFTTNKNMGTGLGLAIVHQIVKGHGGTVTVESQPENGTIFTIHLPVEPTDGLPP